MMAKKKPIPKRPAPDRPGKLDYIAGLKMAAKGACTATVAKAAGSKAATREGQSAVGRKIIKKLREMGQIGETFDRLGYGIERFARQVIEQTEALKTYRSTFDGVVIEQHDDIDWAARARARDQYMLAIGLSRLPHEAAPDQTPLSGLSNAELAALASAAEAL